MLPEAGEPCHHGRVADGQSELAGDAPRRWIAVPELALHAPKEQI
jgi:hypothetical protein